MPNQPVEVVLLKSGNRSFALTLDNTEGAEDVVHSIDVDESPSKRELPPRKPLHPLNQRKESRDTNKPPRIKNRVQSYVKSKQATAKPEHLLKGRENGDISPTLRSERVSEISPRFYYSDDSSLFTQNSNFTEVSSTAPASEVTNRSVDITLNESDSDATHAVSITSPISMKTLSISSPMNDAYFSSDDSLKSGETATHDGRKDNFSETKKSLTPMKQDGEKQIGPPRKVMVPLLSRSRRRIKDPNNLNASFNSTHSEKEDHACSSRGSSTPMQRLRAKSVPLTLQERPVKPTPLQLFNAKASLNRSPLSDTSTLTSNDQVVVEDYNTIRLDLNLSGKNLDLESPIGDNVESDMKRAHSLALEAAKEAVSAMKPPEESIHVRKACQLRTLQVAKEALSLMSSDSSSNQGTSDNTTDQTTTEEGHEEAKLAEMDVSISTTRDEETKKSTQSPYVLHKGLHRPYPVSLQPMDPWNTHDMALMEEPPSREHKNEILPSPVTIQPMDPWNTHDMALMEEPPSREHKNEILPSPVTIQPMDPWNTHDMALMEEPPSREQKNELIIQQNATSRGHETQPFLYQVNQEEDTQKEVLFVPEQDHEAVLQKIELTEQIILEKGSEARNELGTSPRSFPETIPGQSDTSISGSIAAEAIEMEITPQPDGTEAIPENKCSSPETIPGQSDASSSESIAAEAIEMEITPQPDGTGAIPENKCSSEGMVPSLTGECMVEEVRGQTSTQEILSEDAEVAETDYVPAQELSETFSEVSPDLGSKVSHSDSDEEMHAPQRPSLEKWDQLSELASKEQVPKDDPLIPRYIPSGHRNCAGIHSDENDDNGSFFSTLSLDSAVENKGGNNTTAMKSVKSKQSNLKEGVVSNVQLNDLSIASLHTINLSYAEEEKENNSVSSSKLGKRNQDKTSRRPLGNVPLAKSRDKETSSKSAETRTELTSFDQGSPFIKEFTYSTNQQSLTKCDSQASTEPISNINFARLASNVLSAHSTKQHGDTTQHTESNVETLLTLNRIGESSVGLIEKVQRVETLRIFVDEYTESEYWPMLNSLFFNEQIRKIVIFRRRKADRKRVRSPEELDCLFHVLQRLTSLSEVHLWNFEPQDRQVLTLGLAHHASLEYIQLHFGAGTIDEPLAEALATLPKLISLEIEVSDSFPIARLLEAKQLGVLSIVCAEKLTPFEFSSPQIVDLAAALKRNKVLSVLDIEPAISTQDALPAIMEVLQSDNRTLDTFQFSCCSENESDGDLALEKVLGAMEANPQLRVLWNNNYESWTVSTEMQNKALETLRGSQSIQQFHVFLEDANYWYKKNNIIDNHSSLS